MSAVDVNRPITTLAVTAGGSLIAAAVLLAPGLVGGMVSMLNFSPTQAGLVISTELGAFSVTAILATFWLYKVNWRRTIILTLLLAIAGNIASYFSTSFESLITFRLLTGAVSGVFSAIIVATIGMMRDPNRAFGHWYGGQLLFGAIGLGLLPHVLDFGNFNVVFLIMSFLLAILLSTIRYYPSQSRPSEATTHSHPLPATGIAIVGLAAAFIYQTGVFGVWIFFERIGHAGGFAANAIAYSLSVSTLFGIVGSLTASFVTTRWGRNLPIVLGIGGSILSMTVILHSSSQIAYTIIAILFSFSWYFTLPYILAALAHVDSTGRLAIWGNSAIAFGVAAGPVIAGMFQTSGNYNGVVLLGVVCMIASCALILKLQHAGLRHAR